MARIFLVEDDINLANLYLARLRKEGFDAKLVINTDAVNIINSEKPDLVLLDILMPGVTGLSILKTVRATPGSELLPILMLTNDEKADDMEEAIRLGVDGYILKAETSLDALVLRVKDTIASKIKPD